MGVTRRDFLAGSLGSVALAGLVACSDVHSNDSDAGTGTAGSSAKAGSKASAGKATGDITFAVWGGSVSETNAWRGIKQKFEAANPAATVNVKVVPYDGFFSGIDRGIQSGKAPDLFRVDYTTIGKYSSKDVLLDVTPYFTTAEVGAFLPALWDAVKFNGVPYGVPHQTDTSCILYDKAALQDAGITSVPDRLDSAWSWDEFSEVAQKLRASLPAKQFPFAYDWTQAGAFRWLSWLYMAGGTLLSDDLKKVAIPSDAATRAMDFTKSFFDKKWVPSNNTIKTSVYSDNFFLNRTVPMSFVGDFLVPEIADKKDGYKREWAATFMPRDKSAAADLGGNAVVARKDIKNPDLAGAFLRFLVSEDAMKYFCEQAVELPTLTTLAGEKLDYAFRPDAVAICAQQATTISDRIVKESTVPAFADINTILQDQLELAFHGRSGDQTLKAIATKVSQSL